MRHLKIGTDADKASLGGYFPEHTRPTGTWTRDLQIKKGNQDEHYEGHVYLQLRLSNIVLRTLPL